MLNIKGRFPYDGIGITPNVDTVLGEIGTLCEDIEQAVRERG